MTSFSFTGKNKPQTDATDDIAALAKKSAAPEKSVRSKLARITEQKIAEIESAITQDYLKNSKMVTNVQMLERSLATDSPTNSGATILQTDEMDPSHSPEEDDFQPTLLRADEMMILFKDDFFD